MTNKVLVVIPTLNRPDMCRRAVDSLLQQEFTDWTLVIAKNGGPLRIEEYARALAGVLDRPNVSLLVLPKSGLGYALNEVFFHYATGHEYFANLEDDDRWDSTFLTIMVKALSNSGADVAHCLQRQEPEQKQSNGAPMNKAMIKQHNWINFPMCLFCTSLVRQVEGFRNEAGPATDWDFHLRAVQTGARYVFVANALVTHLWHGKNYCVTNRNDGRDYVRKRLKEGKYD